MKIILLLSVLKMYHNYMINCKGKYYFNYMFTPLKHPNTLLVCEYTLRKSERK